VSRNALPERARRLLQRAFNPLPLKRYFLEMFPLSLYNKAIKTDKERGKEKDKIFSNNKHHQGAGVVRARPPNCINKFFYFFTHKLY
jgi:hypothetical protein